MIILQNFDKLDAARTSSDLNNVSIVNVLGCLSQCKSMYVDLYFTKAGHINMCDPTWQLVP